MANPTHHAPLGRMNYTTDGTSGMDIVRKKRANLAYALEVEVSFYLFGFIHDTLFL